MAWPSSVVFRLFVTFMQPTQRVELLGNIFAPSNSSGTRSVCINILEKNQEVLGDSAR